MQFRTKLVAGFLFSLALAISWGANQGTIVSNQPTTAPGFWFKGKELFPLDDQIAHLRVADIDGDGLLDLIIANNTRSKINILYNMTGNTNRPPQTRRLKINELPPDARFKIESITSEKRISSMVVKDLNADGKPDIAYYGEPRELVVCYNQGSNNWLTKRFKITDGQLNPNALEAGDVNGDTLNDIVLLGERNLYVLYQKKDGTFGEPDRIPFSGNVKAVRLADLNLDGRLDLLLVDWEDEYPIRIRIQNANGSFTRETFYKMPQIRAMDVGDFGKSKIPLLVTIAANSGQAGVWRFDIRKAEPLIGKLQDGKFEVLPFQYTTETRGLCWVDLNQDKRLDLVVAEPEAGQITVFQQTVEGELQELAKFPTLAGITTIEAMDWDKDGKPELFVLSLSERQVGFSKVDSSGRIPFPTLIPVDGRPLAMTVGTINPSQPPCLAVLTGKDDIRYLALVKEDGNTIKTIKLAESYRANPSSMLMHDVDQDGLPDLVIFTPYEKIKILRQQNNFEFEEIDITPPGGISDPIWGQPLDIDADGKPELILPQKNFLRAVTLTQTGSPGTTNFNWTLKIKDQINGIAPNSSLGAITIVPTDASSPILCTLDTGLKCLTFYERDQHGAWEATKTISLPVVDFSRILTLPIGSPRTNTLCLVGANLLGLKKLEGIVTELIECDTYETPIKKGRLQDVVIGDLNNDNFNDLIFLETEENHVDIVEVTSEFKLQPGTRWKVFEDSSLRGRRVSYSNEPREAIVADVTGDGKNDLLLVVHDRIILYPQD